MERSKHFPRSNPWCRLSDPANPHKLYRRYDPPLSLCATCKGQHLEKQRYHYYCSTCNLEFHRGCHLIPPEIRHPFHLLHPLTLTSSHPDDYDSSDLPNDWDSSSSHSEIYHFDEFEDDDYDSDGNYKKCKSCRRHVQGKYYHCSLCNFSLDILCALNPPPLVIQNLKSHDHTLTLFPRQVPLPCDACGFPLTASKDHVYSCLLCNYMVHRSCIYLPRVIKLTRHPHRLSHTLSVDPSDEFTCGVCRKTVDINYGQYSCNKGCHYAVHPKCATKDEVWDGKDLEGVAEEEEEDIESFVRIDEETIQHFSHDHHYLKLCGKDSGKNHENKFCQACILPITKSDSLYSCIQCDFVLHEACASLPRRKDHPIHKHPLTLFHPFSPNPYEADRLSKGFFKCDGCSRDACGFMYRCGKKDCNFQLDARCASLSDPSIHGCHPHPLFLNLTWGQCMGCKIFSRFRKFLECVKCKSPLCLPCATLPSVAHYKHDTHPLALCYGEKETRGLKYWCEICETSLDATKWFYSCNLCRVTLHVSCLLGKDVYMKPNHVINLAGENVDIGSNNGNSRPVCDGCSRPCIYPLVYKWLDKNFCSLDCFPFSF